MWQLVKLVAPLVDAFLSGIENRFDHLLQRNDLILASIAHPQFRLRWMTSEEQKLKGKTLLLNAMQKLSEPTVSAVASPPDTDDGCFNYKESEPASASMSSQMVMSLADPSRDVSSLNSSPVIKKVFVSTNMALPSSAPVK
jgi:hypothetical protein